MGESGFLSVFSKRPKDFWRLLYLQEDSQCNVEICLSLNSHFLEKFSRGCLLSLLLLFARFSFDVVLLYVAVYWPSTTVQ